MDFTIRQAKIDDIAVIIKLLNNVTINLLEKGIKQWNYPWNKNEIEEDIRNKNIYVMIVNASLIGTFSIRKIEEGRHNVLENGDYYIYRIALLPEYQGCDLGKEIIEFACEFAREKGNVLYLDCWNGNEKLRGFYLKAGLEYIGDYPEEDYFISIFRYTPDN